MTVVSGVTSLAVQVLAAAPSPSPSPTLKVDPDRVTPGALGFLAIVFLGVAMFFLWKSLNKQMKRVDFDESSTENPRYTRKKAEREAARAAAAEAQERQAADPGTESG